MSSLFIIVIGSLGFLLSMVYIAIIQPVWITFNWHPILMTLYFTLTTLAISQLQRPKNKFMREQSITFHQFFHILAIISQLLGFAAIYYHKLTKGSQHFTSWHGILGIIAILGTFPVMAYGSFSIYFPNLLLGQLTTSRQYYFHRLFGYILYLVLSTCFLLGLQTSWLERTIGPHAWMYFLFIMILASLIYRINFKKLT